MDQLVNFVIRPPRAEYNPSCDLLQPEFLLKGRRYQREDLKITNSQGHVLQCSHYMPVPMSEDKPLPCVIYCHGNSGCRADANEAAVILLPSNITVFTLDFSGSGLSEGEYVTLGWNEMNDLKDVVEHLRTDKRISCIGLWGRSMGAVTSLIYGAQDPSIAGMVLDSPFSNLVDLMMELVDVYKIRLPKFTLKVAVQYMRKLIQKKARFDILDLDAVQVAKKSYSPALFGHATEDLFIQTHHSDLIYQAYAGDKNIIKFEGDHNSMRPQFYFDSISIFFHNVLQPPDGPIAARASGPAYFDMDDLDLNYNVNENVWYEVLSAMQPFQVNLNDSSAVVGHSEEDKAESSQDELHTQWQMSRMEMPANLKDLEEDISKQMGEGNLPTDLSESSSSSCVQRHENGEDLEKALLAMYNGIDNESWGNYFPEEMAVSSDASSQYRFAQFPASADDEERMLMEAIAASLQDLRVTDSEFPVEHGSQDAGEGHIGRPSDVPASVPLQGDTQVNSHTVPSQGLEQGEREVQSSTSETAPIGIIEALGQRWGIGLFRAVGSKQTDSS